MFKPMLLAARVNSDNTVDLVWSENPDSTQYRIFETQNSPKGVEDTLNTSSRRGPLAPGGYEYYVRPYVNGVLGEPSNYVQVGVGGKAAPKSSQPATGNTTPANPAPAAPIDWTNVLFAGDFSKGNWITECGFREVQFQPDASNSTIRTNKDNIPVGDTVIGRAAIFDLPNSYVRKEANPAKNNSFDGKGVSYHSLRFYLEKGFPLGVNDWQLIWQLHGNDETSPKYSLQLRNNELRIRDDHGGWSGEIETGKPYELVLKADRGKGEISVMINDEWKLRDYYCNKSATPYYQKNGWYHTERIGGGKMYQNGIAIGTTLESVKQFL